MKKIFSCTNLSFDNTDKTCPLYIQNKEQLLKIKATNINLSCYADNFLASKREFDEVKDKVVKYFIIINEDVKRRNEKKPLSILKTLKQYKDNIFGLELTLFSKISATDFAYLIDFLKSYQNNFDLRLNLGNMEVFSNEQLDILNNINSFMIIKLRFNQFYAGKSLENNCHDNVYTINELINIKNIINNLISKIPNDYTDIEKVMFVYEYLGKKVHYDYSMIGCNVLERLEHDAKSIYNVLFNCKGVCSSIATTFRMIMESIGIECQVVLGVNHEWNVLKINGIWYHLDLTLDLPNIQNGKTPLYFLKSEKHITNDKLHQIYSYYADEKEVATKSIHVKKYKRL